MPDASERARGDCPVCGCRGKHLLTATDRNREITRERFAYERCERCSTVFLQDVPADLPIYYGGGYYGFRADGEADWWEDDHLLEFQRYRLEMLARHIAPGPLIEVGAGTGGFAWSAQRTGYEVSAIEMDETSCRYLSERLGVSVIQSDRPADALAELPPARVVTIWHVLEHLADPVAVIRASAQRLQPGGMLAIGVPNPDSLQFRLLKARWAHLDAPRHLTLMPTSALIAKAAEFGLRCVEMTADDPFGRHCNLHGWSYALARRPAVGPAPVSTLGGRALRLLARPVERRVWGSATVLLLRREDAR